MEWVASTLHTTSEHGVSNITNPEAHKSAASSRLNWGPADLNGLVRFAERRNLVSARVPSHFKSSLPHEHHRYAVTHEHHRYVVTQHRETLSPQAPKYREIFKWDIPVVFGNQ